MRCGIDEILKLVQNAYEGNISRKLIDKTLKLLIENNIVKSNSVSNRVCLSVPKNNTC